MLDTTPGFGDNVRILVTPLTERLGYAGLRGSVSGETTPSVMGMEVVGDVKHDFALHVMFDDEDRQGAWFAPELVEFIDHAPGIMMQVGDTRMIRRADGEWENVSTNRAQGGFFSWLMRMLRSH